MSIDCEFICDSCDHATDCEAGYDLIECHRYAPRPSTEVTVFWPVLNKYDRCGEWKKAQ